jgi:hypothetical protein
MKCQAFFWVLNQGERKALERRDAVPNKDNSIRRRTWDG